MYKIIGIMDYKLVLINANQLTLTLISQPSWVTAFEKVKFPGSTVCPPKGSKTAFNHDLVNAEIASLDLNVRKEMVEMQLNCYRLERSRA